MKRETNFEETCHRKKKEVQARELDNEFEIEADRTDPRQR